MADREKVIKGLEQFKSDFKRYVGNREDWVRIDAAIEMLKEQEPVQVYEAEARTGICQCGNIINRNWHPEYCGFCGKKLLWY